MDIPWIKHPLRLSGQSAELLPLEERHFIELELLAADKRIWEFYTLDGTDHEVLRKSMYDALTERNTGKQYPFVIVHKTSQKIIGATRLLDLQPQHKKLEIGWTWLHPAYWAGPVNPECKLLLLSHCFEVLGTQRVQLKTDENNLRSRKAIEKIGASFEGILRNDMLRDNGSRRNSAYFSIIAEEWQEIKPRLQALYKQRLNRSD